MILLHNNDRNYKLYKYNNKIVRDVNVPNLKKELFLINSK